jgi:hypothetical protein
MLVIGATNANYSNLLVVGLGLQQVHHFQHFGCGNADIIGSVGNNNIIIGTNISLSNNFTNSINIGGCFI